MCRTTNKELHNLIRGTPADSRRHPCIWNFWTIVARGDGAENGHSSGASGPIASRGDGAIFLTGQKPTEDLCARGSSSPLGGSSSELRIPKLGSRNEQTVRVCAACASLIPIRRKAYCSSFSIRRATNTSRPREHGHTRTDAADTPAPARPPNSRTPENDHHRFMLGFLTGLLFQLFNFLENF